MIEPSAARDAAAAWQPQLPGGRSARDLADALVEPAWGGVRVVVAVDGDGIAAYAHGEPLAIPGELAAALGGAFRALDAVIEGHLTTEALRTGEGAFPPEPTVERPSLFIPRALRERGRDGTRAGARAGARDLRPGPSPEEVAALEALAAGEPHAFVATDLLWLDGQSLLEIPLLERKRWLEHALAETPLVRVSAFVRASSVVTLAGWRSLGFTELSYRGVNSRYLPGLENPDWAVALAPGKP